MTVVGATLTQADIDATAAYAHGPRAWLGTRAVHSCLVVWEDGSTSPVPEVSARAS